jgi:hypothetical protein
MDYGLGAYLTFVVAMAFVLHLLSRRLLVVSLVGAVLCSVLALYYSAWVVNFQVNVAWAPAVLVVLFAEALLVFLVVGLLFLKVRRSRRSSIRKIVKNDFDM